ncbi:MAG: QueT transporter family protein [Tissierellia bacterium]|nr:QueT transporter family protein [Tissierellia bacterium]
MDKKTLTRNAVILALYVLLINVNPVGWGPIQFRIGEMLSVIPFFNRKYIPALVVGGGLANINSPLGLVDIAVGVSCAAITYAITSKVKNPWLGGLIFSAVAGILVAAELLAVYNAPFLLSFLSVGGSQVVILSLGVLLFSGPLNRLVVEE